MSLAIFIVLISLATGTFVNTIRLQRAATSLSSALNNSSFALEQMSREIRVGFGFGSSNENVLRFTNSDGESVSYRLSGSSIEYCNGGSCDLITAPDVEVETLKFDLQGQNPGDNEPPRVTVRISVLGDRGVKVNLQGTTSSRITDT